VRPQSFSDGSRRFEPTVDAVVDIDEFNLTLDYRNARNLAFLGIWAERFISNDKGFPCCPLPASQVSHCAKM
jgi:hypothetical protein